MDARLAKTGGDGHWQPSVCEWTIGLSLLSQFSPPSPTFMALGRGSWFPHEVDGEGKPSSSMEAFVIDLLASHRGPSLTTDSRWSCH